MMENNKCVYLHKDCDGIVRYVGSGTVRRSRETYANSNRGKLYSKFVEANGKLEVEIVAKNLSKLQAEDLERELFDAYKETIMNINRPVSINSMTKEMFDEYVYYDETSKSCLRWKVDRGRGLKANSEAGSLNKGDGYYQVKLQGKVYAAHRIVAVLHGLTVNGFVIDHIDRDRANNKISNLRVVSQKENMLNKSISSRNTSGIQGISYDKLQNRWVVSWCEDGNFKVKQFPILNYNSSEEAFNAAIRYRQQMVELYYINR